MWKNGNNWTYRGDENLSQLTKPVFKSPRALVKLQEMMASEAKMASKSESKICPDFLLKAHW